MTATYRPTPQVPALDGMTPLGVTPQKTIEERVLEWTEQLCNSLEENYKNHSVGMYKRMESNHAKEQLDSVKDGTWKGMKFNITSGKKYYKITQSDWDDRREEYRSGGVHAFVDKKTGEVYKPASWKSPAKHVRYDLRIIREREICLARADWAGGYLYMRG